MRIWVIQIGEPLPLQKSYRKQRLTILSEKLAQKGHMVTRWGSSFDHISKTMLYKKSTEIIINSNITIKIIKGLGYKRNVSLRRYIDHQIISNRIISKAKLMKNPDAILVATPPNNIAYSVVKYANKNNIPVIVDIRDQWPDIILEKIPNIFRKLIKRLLFFEIFTTKTALSKANGLTSMQDSILKWGLKYANRIKSLNDGVFFIGTEKLPEIINMKNVNKKLVNNIKECKQKLVVTFIGTFSTFQNPIIITEVAKRFHQENYENVQFIIAGAGDYYNEVKKKSSDLPNVLLTGWLNQDEISFLVQNSNLGVCPLNKELPFFPNKAFIYFSGLLPIICSTPGDLKEIIKKHNIGLYFDPNDINGLFYCIKKVTDNKKLQVEMKKNLNNIFNEVFDSNKIYEKFVIHIEKIVKNYYQKNII